jgi:polyhydroxyalkanoate synthesis regulator phasin
MALQADEPAKKLLHNILRAASQDEVKQLVEDVVKNWGDANSDACYGFIENMIRQLELFNPMKKEAQAWSNIKMARILFNRVKQQLNTTTAC